MANFSLSPAQEQLIEEIRQVAAERIAPVVRELDEGDDHFDFRPAQALAEHNLLTPTIPRAYGGRGLDYFSTALLLEELGATCAGVATVVTTNIHAAGPVILAGTEHQKKTFLPLLASPEPHLAAFALTEPEAGSDIGAMSALAACEGGVWKINGVKDFVINGGIAHFTTVFATTDPQNKRAGMMAFLLPSGVPGLKVGAVRNKMGIRYARTVQLIMKDTLVQDELVIGRKGGAYLLLMQTFDRGRALAGAVGVGIARAAFEFALRYSKERRQFGRPIFSQQAISFTLAELQTKIESARLLVWKACWLIDNDLDYTMASSMAKIAGSQVAQEATAAAMDILGGRGYLKGCPVEKLLRDARVMSLIEGTNHIQKAVIASQL
ncbi:acyl-CoA dehydrogenase family protein [Desulfallas sp. Bu1-1]|uniref:acyl-CoA dehydrogenase family protein n=1 Tax=Desulfallas sp. Bu1-1 TaxID=2787620 RepID=UPI00189CB3B4|nr:acyl-CoA dehydrogenase family protein [Desulfallas sp. Bu1-1]MBF7084089.1 acyl-CoA dehydrogenase family protein [Desulfallas sp. Bu1-1]